MKNQSSYEKHCDFSISVLEQIISKRQILRLG